MTAAQRQILRERDADIVRDREPVVPACLASHEQIAGAPLRDRRVGGGRSRSIVTPVGRAASASLDRAPRQALSDRSRPAAPRCRLAASSAGSRYRATPRPPAPTPPTIAR